MELAMRNQSSEFTYWPIPLPTTHFDSSVTATALVHMSVCEYIQFIR